MLVRITYFDQNETFARAVPTSGLVGKVVHTVALTDWGDNWLLLDLEESFTYNNCEHTQVLVRSRWEGHAVGDSEPTSVFILLISDPHVLQRRAVTSQDFEWAAWGMAERLSG
jgi:hypothetical protein